HMSRLSEEIITWNSNEYRFIELDDAYSTGTSIMPQKRNPDIPELVSGKTGGVYGAQASLLVTMKCLPLAYNKDMQEDKEMTFDAIDTTRDSILLMTGLLSTASFNPEIMAKSATGGFINATDAADYLVRKGVPFRDAHSIIGRLVLTCIEKNVAMDDLPLEDYKKECEAFDEDIYEAISLKTCVERRKTKGAPGAMNEAVEENRRYLGE
ncbi:MAG: argininosuccinate lyase, partial [Lachnospiraceae bacterium]|nr:argininosuccinate lyase [Candidatus Equihabitans merdae]